MIIVMRDDATQEEIKQVMGRVEELGFTTHPSRGAKKMNHQVSIGDLNRPGLMDSLGAFPGIEKLCVPILEPYKLSRAYIQRSRQCN